MDGADVYESGESDEDCELRIEECEELCFQGCSKDCGLRLCGC